MHETIGKIGVRGIQHVNIFVADVQRARDFYGGVLGLPELPRPDWFDFKGAWFYLGNGQQIHLVGVSPLPARTREHFCVEVANLHAARKHLESQGVAIKPDRDYRGARRFVIFDPDGNYIEICEFSERWPTAWPAGTLPPDMKGPIL